MRAFLSVCTLVLFMLLLAATGATPGWAQEAAGDAFKAFERNGDYRFELDGEVQPEAESYRSNRAQSYLIIVSKLASAVLLRVPGQGVATVPLSKIHRNEDGSVDVLADAVLQPMGSFQLSGQTVAFSVKEQRARLLAKPPLLGLQNSDGVKAHHPEFAAEALRYTPDAATLDALRAMKQTVRVRLFFGSWCPACKRLVPRLLQVEETLAGSTISFEYYGLPRSFRSDAEASQNNIKSIPTAIIYVDEQEAGHVRFTGRDLNEPEGALHTLLTGRQ